MATTMHSRLSGEVDSFSIEGFSRLGLGAGIVDYIKTPKGWNQRPALGSPKAFYDCLHVDYVSNETPEQLEEWIKTDFYKFRLC